MSQLAPKASLTSLPTELLRFIIPDPAKLWDVKFRAMDLHWFALSAVSTGEGWTEEEEDALSAVSTGEGWTEEEEPELRAPQRGHVLHDPNEVLRMLRSISHTCRRLRALALPLLWRVVSIPSIRDLGVLRDALRAYPDLSALIRHFSFNWCTNIDFKICDSYPEEHGTRLDMAFIDRGALWTRMHEQFGSPEIFVREDDGSAYFFHDDTEYYEPGLAPAEVFDYIDAHGRVPSYEERGPSWNCSGPDGWGEDPRIKDSSDFNECISEIVARLRTLQAFGWGCTATCLPSDAFEALATLSDLRALGLRVTSLRNMIHDLPFWQLTGSLESLSIGLDLDRSLPAPKEPEGAVEEGFLAKIWARKKEELAQTLSSTSSVGASDLQLAASIESFHEAALSRTVAAAARQGHLRTLNWTFPPVTFTVLAFPPLRTVFAVPALLPFWVGMAGIDCFVAQGWPVTGWFAAAVSLRPLLAHASLWLSGASHRSDRTLLQDDVRSLNDYFKINGVPEFVPPHYPHHTREPNSTTDRPIMRYLPWLEEAELAQQVADAWNDVVARGGADAVKCSCEKCTVQVEGEATSPQP